ncbi:MAG: nucleotide exchange factor GrpE [Chlamydiota bacterium]
MAEANGEDHSTEEEIKHADVGVEETPQEEQEEREPVTMSITDIELESLRNQAGDYKDKYFRILAESENARKRLTKERQEMVQYTLQNLICDFLTPIDQMENALKHSDKMSDEVKQWSIGFQMILTHFRDVLSNNNVQAFDSVGKEFDPHFHEAVEMVETTEHPAGIVIEESLRGYKMGDKVIRPSRVKVTKKPVEKKDEESAEDDKES